MDSNDLHVTTENGEQCFMWRSNQLTYIAQDRQELPLVLALRFGPLATRLDLSYNNMTSFENINLFVNLNELILDNNHLEDDQLDFKQNLRLKILSINKNKLTDLSKLVKSIGVCYPNLEFLSLIGNPLCPTPILSTQSKDGAMPKANDSFSTLNDKTTITTNGKTTSKPDFDDLAYYKASQLILSDQTEFAYQKYRYFIIYHLPNLRFLDSTPVSNFEREEAFKRCCWIKSGGGGATTTTTTQQQQQRQQVNHTTTSSTSDNRQNRHHHHPQTGITHNNSPRTPNTYNNGTTFELAIISDYSSPAAYTQLADDINSWNAHNDPNQQQQSVRADEGPKFLRLTHKYTGKNSEGNRFIRNKDL